MTLQIADRVLETTTTQGTGTLNLLGPVTGFQGFLDGVADGSLVPYSCEDDTNWEVGIGTVGAGTPDTLARTTVLASSNAGSPVNWGPGTRNVFIAPLAKLLAFRDENLNFVEGFGTGGGTGNAHTLTLTPAPTAYSGGMVVKYLAPAANTGAVTLTVGALPSKALKYKGAAIPSGFITSGMPIMAMYDAVNGWFEVLNFLAIDTDALTTSIRQIPQNSKSAAYTTVLADAGKHIFHPASDNNARTFTIDSNANVAYPIGTAITFVNKINTVTISITSDTLTLAGPGTTGNRSLAANGMATALKIDTTEWIISGTGLT